MKFLIDRCAGQRLAAYLRERGHDVAESRERGPDPGDRALLGWAAAEGRILVTMDKDFGEFLFVEKAPHRGMVRMPDVPAAQRIVIMDKVLITHTQDLLERAVITVRGGRIRISHPF